MLAKYTIKPYALIPRPKRPNKWNPGQLVNHEVCGWWVWPWVWWQPTQWCCWWWSEMIPCYAPWYNCFLYALLRIADDVTIKSLYHVTKHTPWLTGWFPYATYPLLILHHEHCQPQPAPVSQIFTYLTCCNMTHSCYKMRPLIDPIYTSLTIADASTCSRVFV